jgi:deoxyribodipyrimidine photolyase
VIRWPRRSSWPASPAPTASRWPPTSATTRGNGNDDGGRTPIEGGETAARRRFQTWLEHVGSYDELHDDMPADATSRLSPYLRFGCLSPLTLANAVHDRAGPGPAAFVANNSGNWQWTAGTGNDTKPYRRFNPIRQAERFDPDGVYVRRYVPELKSIEGKAVHQPWRLDLDLDCPRPLESRRDEAVWLRDQ